MAMPLHTVVIEEYMDKLSSADTYISLLGLSQVVGQMNSVVLVNFSRNLIETSDECMFYPIDEKLTAQDYQAVGSQRPEAF